MAVKVKWTGNAANLPKERKNDTTPTVRYVGMGPGGNTYQPYLETDDTTGAGTVKSTVKNDQQGKFNAGQYAGDAGKLFLNGLASLAQSGAMVENWIGKGLDKLFPGAGFEGSGLFNVLYNGRPDWKWAGENGLVGIKQDTEYNMERIRENAERTDSKLLQKAAEFGGDTAYALGNALPMAAEAALTGGASMAANLTKEGLLKTGAEVVEKTGVLNTLSKATRDLLTSKDYWTSFASEVGMDYYDALDSGATEDEALRYALASAGLNSVIEIGGGIQKIPERPNFKTWLKSAHEEGMEEVQQGIVSRLLENAVYNKGNPIVSVKDDNAVINPVNALGEYAGGAAVGGILSGGQQLTQRAINRSVRAELNKQAKKVYGDTAQDLVAESLELSPNNELATRLQDKLDNGEQLTGNELRQLVEQNENSMVASDKASIQSAVENRLSELGATNNVSKMAEIITQQISGEDVADSDRQLVENSKAGRQVRQELNPENIRVGAENEAWTGNIGTARINTTAYNRDMQKTGVTGAKYNAETGRLDAIVTNEAGEVKTVPAAEAEMTPMQEELFDWADELKLEAAGPLMVRAYQPEQNMELYTRSFKLAYEYGKAGMPMDYVEKSEGVNYLQPTQIKLAYEEGQAATQRKVQAREEKIRSGGTTDSTTKKKGSVSLRGAKVGGKTYAPVNRKTVDSRQWASVKAMRAFSRAVGVDVVFYQSQANERGVYEGANGFYKDGKLYLDINAGRDTVGMTETAILKTAAHELTHFIQANSAQYEALKSFVVNKLTHEEGVSFEDLVADKQRRETGLEYDEAVDEVVADACEMMLGNSTVVEQLAKENRSLAEKIRDWLREWVENLKIALEGLQADRTESRAMMQYARELQEIWDNALMDAARNNRGTQENNAPAEIKRQVRVETSESIEPDEKPLKGKRDDGKMGTVRASLKEDLKDGRARKEDRGAFLRRATGEGLRVFEGDSIAYGYRSVRWESARENARQVQKELTALGIDAEITDGYVHWNLDGISCKRAISQAVTIERRRILISNRVSLPSKNAAGHEAFHLWGGTQAREAYANEVVDNLNYSSREFVEYQAVIAEAYLGGEADLSDSTQLQKLREELFAYISGDIHEGVNDDLLRPMFHDYDAVKAAWVKLCKDNSDGEVRFSLRSVPPVKPQNGGWERGATFDEVKTEHPTLFALDADESSTRNPTQISGTVKSYRKIFDALKEEGFDGTILDASSGLGYGTRLGREEYGYRVDDIEPFPDAKYKPRYTDYSALDNTYDAIISNAVLNVIPQDLRDAMVVKIGEMLNPGGRAFINVRGTDVKNASSKVAINESGMEYFISNTGSYQKGFTTKELVAYLRDALGDGFTVRATNKFGAVSAIVTKNEERVQSQQRDPRLSDRDVLSLAADMALRQQNKSWTPEDRNRLEIFTVRLRRLEEAQAELKTLKEERKDLLDGRKASEVTKDERLELTQNKNRTDLAKKNVEKREAQLYEIESIEAVKTLLRKSREVVEKETAFKARQRYREKRNEAQQKAVERRKAARAIMRLAERMNTNSDKKHIPEALKVPVGELLESLNLYSAAARKGTHISHNDNKYFEAMSDLKNVLEKQKAYEEGKPDGEDVLGGYPDLPMGFENMLAGHIDAVKKVMEKQPLKTDVVQAMDLDDLKNLNVILSVITTSVSKMNKMFVNKQFGFVSDAAEDSIYAMEDLGQHNDKIKPLQRTENQLLWDNTLPWYAFQRFGQGGRAVLEGLMDGQDKLAFNMKAVLDFRESLPDLISDETIRQLKKWDAGKEVSADKMRRLKNDYMATWSREMHTVKLTDKDGHPVDVELSTGQIIDIYWHSKRRQSWGHLFGEGIRPSAVKLKQKDKKGREKLLESKNRDEHFKVSPDDLAHILKLMTPDQLKVAQAMQKFMTEKGSFWGNEISMARHGYRAFTEEFYVPIETDSQDRAADMGDNKEGSLYRLQNISAVKSTKKDATNALVIRDAFDVFTDHMADMAKYNALVLPIIDAQRWYNYRYTSKEGGESRNVKRAMTKAYGKNANDFVVTFLRDLNGVKESSDRGTSKVERATSFYKRTAVAANLRVAVLQVTAYVRASFVLDYKYMGKALLDKTGTAQAKKEMLENSGIALWKSLGFFDTNVGRSVRDKIRGDGSKVEDLVDKTMVPAELGDTVTWARLWRACKLEVQDQQHLTGKELLEETARRFREVVYKTQVVDSTMTRSHNMRAGSAWAKTVTAFMSEPTVSYNMVMESTRKTAEDAKRLGMRVAVKRNGKILVRAYQAYILTEVASAIIESIADAFRDPDDDPFFQKFWTAFWGEKPESFRDAVLGIVLGTNGNLVGNLNPLGKIPLLKDALSALSGEDVSRMDMEALTNTYKALAIWDETIRLETGELDKATKTTYYGNMTTYGKLYQTSKALSQLSGLPVSSAAREVATWWNNSVGIAYPDLKARTYEDKQLREAWENYGKASGVSYAVMYRATQDTKDFESDKDADGNTISGSLKAKYVDYIKGLGLNRAQGKAVWEAAKNPLWSDKGTPWG